ncbi:MAG: GatB/YqeY domain-containing protein [Patescibacteria group bacterium]|nr:GatB/YqeY domain-containing protein [Patescibacteria group bacterium]MCL5093626.1 GatB/YqeY domain-containing protein [Patescibacteria group bacterium]
MSLYEKIEEDFKLALKEKRELDLSVLRLLKTAIKNAEILNKRTLSEDELASIIEKQVKQRKDSISQFEAARRSDLKEKEENELPILEKYLPEKMSEEETKAKVQEIISGLPQEQKANFGQVMGKVMSELKGKTDPAIVSKYVKEILETS